jgi:hypothetical protein
MFQTVLLGFFSGIGVSVLGAWWANTLTRRRERKRLVQDRRLEIYMKLMNLHSKYFWFSTSELHKEEVPPEVRRECYGLAWQVADILRSIDEFEFLEETMEVIFGPSFDTAQERHKAMGKLLDQLASTVNPRYSQKIGQISEVNLRLLGSGGSSNAPGAPRAGL